MASVPRLFPNQTITCIAGGPSLLASDVELCRGTTRVIAVNDAYRLAPWADALFACDAKWWKWNPAAAEFAGLKYALRQSDTKFPASVELLKNTGVDGLESSSDGLRTGRNSGYQAIGLAVHLGATRILLLGYDMKVGENGEMHWFGHHPDRGPSPFGTFVRAFDTIVAPLQALGITVINCSRRTALTQFQQLTIERVLSSDSRAA